MGKIQKFKQKKWHLQRCLRSTYHVAALRCRALIDVFGKSLAKLSGVTPAGFFFAGYVIMMSIVVLKSHGCEAVAPRAQAL